MHTELLFQKWFLWTLAVLLLQFLCQNILVIIKEIKVCIAKKYIYFSCSKLKRRTEYYCTCPVMVIEGQGVILEQEVCLKTPIKIKFIVTMGHKKSNILYRMSDKLAFILSGYIIYFLNIHFSGREGGGGSTPFPPWGNMSPKKRGFLHPPWNVIESWI